MNVIQIIPGRTERVRLWPF